MDAWERYFNDTNQPDTLIQLAILHMEFEALHPFKDGNGRIGRMVIPLFLTQRALLKSPDLYISAYLEANRDEYLERLRSVSRDGDWTPWCVFFLRALTAQASENEKKARQILKLYENVKLKAADATHSQHAIRAVDFIFKVPVFSVPTFIRGSGIPKPTATRIVGVFEEQSMISALQPGRGSRAGIYAFAELINITEGSEVFVSHR
jgi:Fic family protein